MLMLKCVSHRVEVSIPATPLATNPLHSTSTSMSKTTRPPATAPTPEIVDPRWILKALAIVIVFSVFCAYITTCVVFYRSQWQLAVSPSRVVAGTPASIALPFTDVRFGADDTGQPQLSGWWIPSAVPDGLAALVLHQGTGSISDALPQAQLLHAAGLSVLLFDYRGFGQSGGRHPTQTMMQQDAASALRYLTDARHLPPGQIVVFGTGVGASLGVQLCAANRGIRALVLEDADGDIDHRVGSDSRASIVPARLLFHEKFPLAAPLSTLTTPKLLITHTLGATPEPFRMAADPKVTVELPRSNNQDLERQAMQRFLNP
jgi:pimeloyl-ACP methyl ester carboxylesterase